MTSPHRRGAEWGAIVLDRALTALGVPSEVVSLTGSGGEGPLQVDRLGQHSLAPTTLRRLRARAAGKQVVVAHGSRTLPACALALAGTSIPFVYKNIGDTSYWSNSPGRRLRVGLALRRAAMVVAMTADARASMIRVHGLAEDRVAVIPSWRSSARWVPPTPQSRAVARKRFGLPDQAFVFIALGALAPEKRVDRTIAALAELPDAWLLVVGDGPERLRLEEQASTLLPGRAVFAGALDDPEVALHAADALVLSSESEGVPGVLIEAGMSALPSVAFDVGGVATVIEHGRTGYVVRAGDVVALTAACRDVTTHNGDMGREARRVCIERYELSHVVDRWVDLLSRTAGASLRAEVPAR